MSDAPKKPTIPLATLAALGIAVSLSEESRLPDEKPLFHVTPGQDRRARIQTIHDRTGWVFAECRRLVDTKSDREIEAIVREHEAGKAGT